VEVFTAVWKGAGSFKGESKATTWMIGIARNLAFKELRHKKLHESIETHPDITDDKNPNGNDLSMRQLIKKALSLLSYKHQEVLDLVFFYGMTYPEISQILEVPVNTIKTRVYHAKSAMKKIMEDMGVSHDDL
jgi:RNA polymerase sigma-70 factor (ECF subfamily)